MKQPVPTDVQALINNCLEALEPLAEAKGLQMVLNCDRAPDKVQTPTITADCHQSCQQCDSLH